MTDNYLESTYNDNSAIVREIEALVSKIITEKSLRFNLAEATFNFPKLAAAQLINQAEYWKGDRNGTFAYDNRILYEFVRHFSGIFNYTFSDQVQEALIFAEQVAGFFQENDRNGVAELKQAIAKFLIEHAISGCGLNPSVHALSVYRAAGSEDFFLFFKIYFGLSHGATANLEEVWIACCHYATELGPPKEGTIDMVWRNFEKFLEVFIDQHTDKLPVIRKLADQMLSEPGLDAMRMAVFNKLSLSGEVKFTEIISWLENEPTRFMALTLLILRPIADDAEQSELLGSLSSLSLSENHKHLRLTLLVKLLNIAKSDNEPLKTQIKVAITDHFNDQELKDLSTSFIIMSECTGDIDFCYGLMEAELLGVRFQPNWLPNMGAFFIKNKDLKMFFGFLRSCSNVLPATTVKKGLEMVLYLMQNESVVDFEREIILLCIDFKGQIRYLGHLLLFDKFRLNERASLTYDVLQLDKLQQYKLIISLLNPYHQVDHTIPLVVPLLQSPSEIVRELLACKLEELIPSYRNEVILELQDIVDPGYAGKNELIARVQKVLDDLDDELSLKAATPEFDPHLSKTEEIRSFMRAMADTSRKTSKKAKANHKGISSIMKQTQVARGGGTVMPDGTVFGMMHTSMSFTMPRTMFIVPELFDYERQLFYSENWEKEFEQWEQIILL